MEDLRLTLLEGSLRLQKKAEELYKEIVYIKIQILYEER